jgi:hypothetical protein
MLLLQTRRTGEWMYRLTSSKPRHQFEVRLASRPFHFNPGEKAPGIHWIGDCMLPRSGVDDVERRKILPLLGLELWPLGRPADCDLLIPFDRTYRTWTRCQLLLHRLETAFLRRAQHIYSTTDIQSSVKDRTQPAPSRYFCLYIIAAWSRDPWKHINPCVRQCSDRSILETQSFIILPLMWRLYHI